MIKYIETTGKNEDEAIAAALQQLNMDRDDVSVEIISRAKTGFLGIGNTPAKVRVSYEGPDDEPVVSAPVSAPAAKPAAKPVSAPRPAAPAAPVQQTAPEGKPVSSDDEVAARITDFLNGLFQRMDVQAVPEITVNDEGTYCVVLGGSVPGSLIGRRGETLDAIQQLTSYTVNRDRSKRVRIHMDAENYRAKREDTLRRLAEKTAQKVVKYRRNVILEPMNAYERHVIHTALQEYPGVTTYSTGTDPHRRTVVAFSPEKK